MRAMAIRINKNGQPEFAEMSAELKAASDKYKRLSLARALLSYPGKELPPPDPELEEASRRLHDETVARLDQLVAHFGIDPTSPDRLAILAIVLANEFVKGFSVDSVKRRGRPRGRAIPCGLDLVISVEAIVQEGKLGIAGACKSLSRRSGPWKGANPGTLQTRYHEWKSEMERLAKVMRTVCRDRSGNSPEA